MAGDLIALSFLTLSEKPRLIVLANLPTARKPVVGKQKTGCKWPVIGKMLLHSDMALPNAWVIRKILFQL